MLKGFLTKGPVSAFFVCSKLATCALLKTNGVSFCSSSLMAFVSMLRLGRELPKVLDKDIKERMSVRFTGFG